MRTYPKSFAVKDILQTPSHLPNVPDGVEVRHIPGLGGYAASSDGRIWRCRRCKWQVMPLCDNGSGYLKANFETEEGRKTFKIHRLILATFVGPKPDGMDGCHNDGNKKNNNLSNLRWDTRGNNVRDAHMHRNGMNDGVIKAIQVLYANGFTTDELWMITGIKRSIVESATHEDYERINVATHQHSH